MDRRFHTALLTSNRYRMLHVLPTSFYLIYSLYQYLVKNAHYEAPQYIIFSTSLLLHLPKVQMFSSASCSQTH